MATFATFSFSTFSVATASEKPSNISIDCESETIFLRWNYSYNASYTIIILNDETIPYTAFNSSTSCSYDITEIIKNPNHYVFKLFASDENGAKSPDCSVYEYTVSKPLSATTNIRLENNILSWDAVDNADHYEVLLNSISVRTTHNTLNLNAYIARSLSFDASITAHSNTKFYLPSSPKTIPCDYHSPVFAPTNVSIVFLDGEYFMSWTRAVGALRYYYCDENAAFHALDWNKLNEKTLSTEQNFANITDLIHSGCETVCIFATDVDGNFSAMVRVEVNEVVART